MRLKERIERVEGTDIALILGVPAVLVVVQLLPESVRVALVLNYGSPGVVQVYTTHFVHAGFAHLAGNIVVYLIAVALVYLLLLYADARRMFYVGFVLVLLFVPFPVSALDLYLVGPEAGDASTRGFSGLASAFVGFVPVAVFVFLRENLSKKVRVSDSWGLFLASFGFVVFLLDLIYLIAVVFITVAIHFHLVLRRLDIDVGKAFGGWSKWEQAFIVYAVLLFLISPVILFPANPAQGDTVVNLVTHFGGFFIGYVLGGVGVMIRVWWS